MTLEQRLQLASMKREYKTMYESGQSTRSWGIGLTVAGSVLLVIGASAFAWHFLVAVILTPVGGIMDLIGGPLWGIGQGNMNRASRLLDGIRLREQGMGTTASHPKLFEPVGRSNLFVSTATNGGYTLRF